MLLFHSIMTSIYLECVRNNYLYSLTRGIPSFWIISIWNLLKAKLNQKNKTWYCCKILYPFPLYTKIAAYNNLSK